MASPAGSSQLEIAERLRIFRALVPYFGTVQPATFFQRTSDFIVGIQRIHPWLA
jgi:hypothetical protein